MYLPTARAILKSNFILTTQQNNSKCLYSSQGICIFYNSLGDFKKICNIFYKSKICSSCTFGGLKLAIFQNTVSIKNWGDYAPVRSISFPEPAIPWDGNGGSGIIRDRHTKNCMSPVLRMRWK